MPAAVDHEVLNDKQVELVNANLGLAYAVAAESRERRIDSDDVRQAAVLGLIEAVLTHDPSKGALSTHATWCARAAIQRAARQARPLIGLADLGDGGVEPVDGSGASDFAVEDAERLRAVVAGLPEQARSVVIDRYWRGNRPRSDRAKAMEATALHALRAATRNGTEIPTTAVHWLDPATGERLRPTKLSPDDERTLRHVRLLPRFPVAPFTRESKCAHKGPLPRGSSDYCPCCDKSGLDGIVIPVDVKPLPRDPKPAEPKKAEPTRKERRKAQGRGPARKAG